MTTLDPKEDNATIIAWYRMGLTIYSIPKIGEALPCISSIYTLENPEWHVTINAWPDPDYTYTLKPP